MKRESPIFIGSSSEQKKLAKKISDELTKHQFHPMTWWNKEVFRAGDVTLDRLVQLAKICEASVLIFGSDDKTWSRGVKTFSVRDNVLLEHGIFLGLCDREHSIIVADKKSKIPSDLQGITVVSYESGRESLTSISERVADHFRQLILEENKDFQSDSSIILHSDRTMHINQLNANDKDWSLASLYQGKQGAIAWKNVEMDSQYASRVQTTECGAQIGRLVGIHSVSTVISLGPGAGSIDMEVMANLKEKRWREYIPVDINQYLLIESASRVSDRNAMTECVRGILCDFDKNLSFVGSTVKRHSKGPRLFLMAGGTFGNSSQTETALLAGLYSIMSKDDLFVFDLFCYPKSYDVRRDPLHDLKSVPTAIQEFLANGVRGITNNQTLNTTAAINNILVKESSGVSLANTKVIEMAEITTGTKILRVKRFKRTEITKAIKDAGFGIVDTLKTTSGGMLERYILLARK